MHPRFPLLLLLFLGMASLSHGQDTLFFEDFEGTGAALTLNSTDVSSVVSPTNSWIINNSYTGGSGSVVCFGFPLTFTIPNTPAQPAALSPSNGNYLHVVSSAAQASNVSNACFLAADGICTNPDNIFSKTLAISTSGYQNVSFDFWWLGIGGPTYYGEIYYSLNGGTSWTKLVSPISNYFNQSTWTSTTITNAMFDNQSDLRFGFRFVNATGNSGSDPALSFDNLLVRGTALASIDIDTLSTLTYCPGDTISVPYTGTGNFGGSNVMTLQLSDGSGSFFNPFNLGISPANSGTIQGVIPAGISPGSGYSVRIVSSTPQINGNSYPQQLTILSSPFAGTILASPDSVCPGDSLSLMISAATGNLNWTVSTDSINFSATSGTSPAYTVAPAQTSFYSLIATNQCGTDTAVPVRVTVLPLPQAGVLTASADTVCAGSALTLLQSGSNSPFEWTTSTDGITFSPTGTTSNSLNDFPNQTNWYGLIASNMCGADTALPVMVVTVAQPTAGNISASADTICQGDSVNMQVSGVSGGDASWLSSNDGITFNPTGNSGPAYGSGSLSQSTWYVVQVSNPWCQFVYSDTFRIEVIPLPTAAFSLSANQLVLTCTDQSTGASSWNWDFGDGNTSTQQNPVHTYASPGTYLVSLTVSNGGCTDVFQDSLLISLTSREWERKGIRVELFPNPASGNSNLRIETTEKARGNWSLISSEGKVIFAEALNLTGEKEIGLPLQGLSAGLYLVRIHLNGKSQTLKLILK